MSDERSGSLGGLTVGTFPFYPEQVRKLVASHQELQDHRLLLAIWYDKDDPRDIKLLEVLDGFPTSDVPSELFTTYFTSSTQFLIAAEGRLVLTLTSPEEMETALDQGFPAMKMVKASFERGQAEILYRSGEMDAVAKRLANG